MKPEVSCQTIAFVLFSTNFFNYAGWDQTYAGWCSYFIYVFLICYVYFHRDKISAVFTSFKKELWVLILLPLLGTVIRSLLSSGSFINERQYILPLSVFLFYYIYNIYRIEEQDICNIFTAIALCAFGIQIVQLLYPQSAVFGIYDEGIRQSRHVMVEIRNGIYRFRLETYFFTLFCLYYYWNRLLAKLTLRNIALFSVFLASTYLYLTRQIMIAVVITLMCSYLFIKNTKARVVSIMLIGILSLVLLQYSSELFKELFNRTKTELVSMNVRVISTGFYWEKICENPITFLFGNGHPTLLSKWAKKGLFPSDIGLIGEMFYYGILWIILYLYTVYLILVKYGKRLPLYIKLFVFGTFTNSIMIFPYRNDAEYFVWTTILYLASLYLGRYRNTTCTDKTIK